MKCQFDAFADYVSEADAKGIEHYPLYEWTKKTIAEPAKKAKYLKSFTIYVGGREVYEKAAADALEADLRSLVGGPIVVKVFRYDTDPAHNPQPPRSFTSAPLSSSSLMTGVWPSYAAVIRSPPVTAHPVIDMLTSISRHAMIK